MDYVVVIIWDDSEMEMESLGSFSNRILFFKIDFQFWFCTRSFLVVKLWVNHFIPFSLIRSAVKCEIVYIKIHMNLPSFQLVPNKLVFPFPSIVASSGNTSTVCFK